MNCSCLLPVYNEASRVKSVLGVLTKVSLISEIIIVNDGSTDNTQQIIEKKFPQLKLISLPKNQGKASAVKQGLQYIKTSHVLLFDADLKNVKISEINVAIKLMFNQPRLDMVILKRIHEVDGFLKTLPPIFTKSKFLKNNIISKIAYKAACILSGERIIKTKLLKKIFETKINGYCLEVAINQYCQNNNKKVCWVSSSALNDFKIKDLGTFGIINKYILMILSIMSRVGIKHYIHQIRTFCTDECKLN